jgi:hypothetical protein
MSSDPVHTEIKDISDTTPHEHANDLKAIHSCRSSRLDAQTRLMAYVFKMPRVFVTDQMSSNVNAKLANPLRGIPHDQLMKDVDAFAEEKGITLGN